MQEKPANRDVHEIEPGMVVEASGADLGEEDVSKPRVADVVRDQNGNVRDVVVTKGTIFRKTLDIPPERIQAVEQKPQDEKTPGKVRVEASEEEMEALKPVGEEPLDGENPDWLDRIEQDIPTVEGLREMEADRRLGKQTSKDTLDRVEQDIPTAEGLSKLEAEKRQGSQSPEDRSTPPKKPNFLLSVLGPGFLAGMAGNDSSAVTAYSVDGATAGYSHLWLLLLSTPLYQAVQFSCAKIGRMTQMGFAEILRSYYNRWVAMLASFVLIVANVALIAADLVAVGSGLELITHISWMWFVLPIALLLWYLTVYRSFETIKKIFIVMSLAFVTYIVTAIFSKANGGMVLYSTFVPQVSFNFASVSSAVALLGATISPYTMFWQVQGEKEEKRSGPIKKQVRSAAIDILIGVVSGNLVSYFIIVCTAATLFTHHQRINTAADAARSLEPLLGPFAEYLFAIGLIGAGLIAIPVLLASTSYAVAGTFGWPSGLSKKPWQNEGFYLILTTALIVSMVVAFLRFEPIQLLFWANVLSGVLAPVLVIYLIVVGNNRKIMKEQRLGWITNAGLVLTVLVMLAAAALLFYGLFTGQGS